MEFCFFKTLTELSNVCEDENTSKLKLGSHVSETRGKTIDSFVLYVHCHWDMSCYRFSSAVRMSSVCDILDNTVMASL